MLAEIGSKSQLVQFSKWLMFITMTLLGDTLFSFLVVP